MVLLKDCVETRLPIIGRIGIAVSGIRLSIAAEAAGRAIEAESGGLAVEPNSRKFSEVGL